MNNFNLSNKQISESVSDKLKELGWSLRRCVKEYNSQRKFNSSYKQLPELNKDFLLRVKNNNFDVANNRVAQLCDFLKIDVVTTSEPKLKLHNEFERIEALLKDNPHLFSELSSLLNSITKLAANVKGVTSQ